MALTKHKFVIKWVITAIAISVAIVHLIFPSLSIDGITVTLLAIAVIPWLEPLFKSIELPGGLKMEFQAVKEVEKEARKAGLIKEPETIVQAEIPKSEDTLSFMATVRDFPKLALPLMRVEIEKRIRELANRYGIEAGHFALDTLIHMLSQKQVLSKEEGHALVRIKNILNQAVHGMHTDEENAQWVMDNGIQIIEALDAKLEFQTDMFTVSAGKEKEHWIDQSFAKASWTTNQEWGAWIDKHRDMWETEMKNVLDALMNKISPEQQTALAEAQKAWLHDYRLNRDFFYSFGNVKEKIGREGMFVAATSFMNKIRTRTLELTEMLTKLAS